MKKTLLLLALLVPILLRAENPPPPAPLTVAVFDFQPSGERFEKKGAEAAILLNAQLSAAPNVLLVERQELAKVMGEQELGLSGTVTPDSAAKIGALTGAKVLVTGRVFDAGEKIFLVAKIMSTETGRVYGETVTFNDLAAMEQAVGELVGKVRTVLEKHGDTLLAKIESPEERLARLKKIVEGKKLRSVSVAVTEQHINRAVIDPAVQTEMQRTLQQLGCEVIDPKTAQQPAVAITGEAFSELGGMRGNLITCRARVEIKVTDAASGKLLLADRQTDVAVDLAENVAGKRALENAALKLLDRIVPVLVAE